MAVTGRARANPYFTIPSRVLGRYASLPETDPQAPGAFALASVDRLRSVLAEAGFRDLHVETIEDKALEFETGREYWDYIRGFSMAESVLAQIPADQHESIGEEIAAMAAGGDPDGRVELMGEWNLASGVK